MKLEFLKLLPQLIRNKLDGRDNLKKILGNTGWLFADKILRLGIELFLGVWLARYLGVEQFGLYSYVLAFVALFRAFAALGLDRIVVRDIVNSPESRNEIISTAFVLKLLGGVVSVFIAFTTIKLLRPDDTLIHTLVLIISCSLIIQAFDVIDFWFQSQVRAKYTVIAKNTVFIVTSLVKFYLIVIQAPLIAFAWIILAEFTLYGIALTIAFWINNCFIETNKFQLSKAKTILKDSLPLMLSSVAIMIYMKIDQIMLGEMTNSQEVGIYSAAVNISEAWYFVPVAIANSVFPSILKYRQQDRNLYYKKLQQLFIFMVAISYVVAIAFTIFSQPLVNLLFGEVYQKSASVLAIHIWAGIFVSLGVIRGLWVTAENINNFTFFSTAIGAIVNVLLNFILIPLTQSYGASIATIISYSIAAFLIGFCFKRTQKISLMMTKSLILVS